MPAPRRLHLAGFLIAGPVSPALLQESFDDDVDEVVPERRGRYRTAYAATTLPAHLQQG